MTPPKIGDTRPAPERRTGDPLRAARVILERPQALDNPCWARSVALLARQALEEAIADFWARNASGMHRATWRSRFVALRFYVEDPERARDVHHLWATLSEATHHQGYELAPTAGELRAWLDDVSRHDAWLRSDGPAGPLRGGARGSAAP